MIKSYKGIYLFVVLIIFVYSCQNPSQIKSGCLILEAELNSYQEQWEQNKDSLQDAIKTLDDFIEKSKSENCIDNYLLAQLEKVNVYSYHKEWKQMEVIFKLIEEDIYSNNFNDKNIPAMVYYFRGRYNYHINNYEEAFAYYQKMIDYLNNRRAEWDKVDSSFFGTACRASCGVLKDLGRFAEAEIYGELGLEHEKSNNNSKNIAFTQNFLGGIYERQSKYQLAKNAYQEAYKISIDLHQQGIVNLSRLTTVIIALARINRIQGNYDKALQHLQSLKKHREEMSKSRMRSMFREFALWHTDQRFYPIAISYYDSTLLNCQVMSDSIEVLHEMTDIFLKTDQFKKANVSLAARRKLARTQNLFEQDASPIDFSYDDIVSKAELLEAFTLEARFHYKQFEAKGATERLMSAWSFVQKGLSLAEAINNSLLYQDDKINMIENTYSIFDLGLEVGWKIAELHPKKISEYQLLKIAEMSRAVALKEMATFLQSRNGVDLTDHGKEVKELKRQISILWHMKIESQKSDNPDKNSLEEINQELVELRKIHEAKLITLKREAPNAYRGLYSFFDTLQFNSCIKQLDQNQSVLQYFVGEKKTYGFLVDKMGKVLTFQSDIGFSEIDELVRNLKRTLQNHYSVDSSEELLEISIKLHQKIIAPIADLLPPRLIIIPDGPLYYLPFEILTSKHPEGSNNFKDQFYLIRKHSIAYQYSFAMVDGSRNKLNKQAQLVVFAPKFQNSKNNTYSNIPNQGELITHLQARFPGKSKVFSHRQLSVNEVERNIPIADILQFHSHGALDNQNSNLSFISLGSSIKLPVARIYHLKSKALLTSLIGCYLGSENRTIARGLHGEGLISVSRAFFSAGTKSIYTPLWQYDQIASYEITKRFYDNLLLKGLKKDEALAKAKISFFLDSEKNHPYFWASPIIIGNTNSITIGGT